MATAYLEDEVYLVYFRFSPEKRLLVEEFSKDTSNRPHVHSGGVFLERGGR